MKEQNRMSGRGLFYLAALTRSAAPRVANEMRPAARTVAPAGVFRHDDVALKEVERTVVVAHPIPIDAPARPGPRPRPRRGPWYSALHKSRRSGPKVQQPAPRHRHRHRRLCRRGLRNKGTSQYLELLAELESNDKSGDSKTCLTRSNRTEEN